MLRRLAGGGAALALIYLVAELCGVARIALFAHVLAPASMGALIILGTWLRLIEMATDLSVDRYLLREPGGARRAVQNGAHGAALLRGIAGSAFMAASLYPLLAIYELQAAAPAFMAVSLVPLIRGFTHFDYRLQNRFMKLRSTYIVELGSALAGLAAAAAGAFLAPGPDAFAATLLAQAIAAVAISHLCASRTYAISFDRAIARRIWHFGWPLTVNALFLYAVFQGERMIVGGMLGLETLGSYAIVAQLALLPVMICGRLALNLAMPLLARGNGETNGAAIVTALFASGGMVFWAGFVLLSPPFVALLFGKAYLPHPGDLAWIAAAAAIRMQKTGPATVLLAAGRSREVLSGSSIRLAGLAIGTAALFLTRDLTVFLVIAALSEAASHAVITRRTMAKGAGIPALMFAPLPVLAAAALHAQFPAQLQLDVLIFAAITLVALLPLARIAQRHFPVRAPVGHAAAQPNG